MTHFRLIKQLGVTTAVVILCVIFLGMEYDMPSLEDQTKSQDTKFNFGEMTQNRKEPKNVQYKYIIQQTSKPLRPDEEIRKVKEQKEISQHESIKQVDNVQAQHKKYNKSAEEVQTTPELTSANPVISKLLKQETTPQTAKVETPKSRKGKRYCVPHADLEKQHGLPGPCNDSLLVLDCPDPYVEYLRDPLVLTTCRVKNDSRATGRRRQIIKGPGKEDCGNSDGVLVSNSSLPVSPKPQPIPGKVPRIIHYVSLGCNRIFTFSNYLSVLSVHRFIKPDRIFFHGDCTPKGPWWKRSVDEFPNIYFRERDRTKLIQGKPPMWVEHETDIIRLQAILAEGGIYLDTDVLVLAPVDDLLHYPVTLGQERPGYMGELGSSFILSEAGSPFVCMWLYAFREYNPKGMGDWARYAIIAPGRIATAYPNLIHTEPRRFFQPAYYDLPKIYGGFYDWSKNYILHMWNKNADKKLIPKSPSEIPPLNETKYTLQEVFRYLYFNETIIHAKDKTDQKNKKT